MNTLILAIALSAVQSAVVVQVDLVADLQQTLGRVRLYLDYQNTTRPVDNNSDGPTTNQMFGVDRLETATSSLIFDNSILGFPIKSIDEVPDGDYFLQAELLPYDLMSRKDLPDVYMPRSCVSCSGQDGAYDKPDGTLFSEVTTFSITNGSGKAKVLLNSQQPVGVSAGCAGLGDAIDSEEIKTVRIRSELLSNFWQKDMFIEACVLLPHQFELHPDARYPLAISHGHYNPTWNAGSSFNLTKPSDCSYAEDGYDCITTHYNYYFAQNWTSMDADASPFVNNRMLLLTINHKTPFFDDSYAINSENSGPFGDAIVFELIPEVEKRFRGIGQGWARGVFGGSTGGWISAAHQVLYPDEFSFALSACPDSVTFTHHTAIELYKNDNAYFYNSKFKKTQIPGYRDGYSGVTYPGDNLFPSGFVTPYGNVVSTAIESNHRELVLGDNTLSCEQWDAWEASWSPVNKETGFPKRIWNKLTGEIDKEVSSHWKENFDLAHIMTRDWTTLGPKLKNKLHFAVGASDSFYLTNPTFDALQQLNEKVGEDHGISFVFGEHEGLGYQHCFNGYLYDEVTGEKLSNSITRLHYANMNIPRMGDSFRKNAPPGADLESWFY
ncbi:hypothetical protein ScalyP_jg5415 [Parmales sp. scaly parma]|nr:hypothetical protein ScalyP_jg5415 [Parmales sp. scaly parma]